MGTFCRQETGSDLQSGNGNRVNIIMFNVYKESNLDWNLDGIVLRPSNIYSISILNTSSINKTDITEC